jgi:TetR/AcrR family transcriptional regulator, repressor for neighboring sulfatase
VSDGRELKGVRGRPPKDASAPRGPEDVLAAVLASATSLFAERGIAAVPVREVATAAGVNPGLVHRYIGGKDDLVRAVIHRASDDLSRALENTTDPAYAEGPTDQVGTYERILAHLILEGYDIDSLHLEFPLMHFVIERVIASGTGDEREARLVAVCLLALDIGWRLFAPLVETATEVGPADRLAVQQAVDATRRRIGAGR